MNRYERFEKIDKLKIQVDELEKIKSINPIETMKNKKEISRLKKEIQKLENYESSKIKLFIMIGIYILMMVALVISVKFSKKDFNIQLDEESQMVDDATDVINVTGFETINNEVQDSVYAYVNRGENYWSYYIIDLDNKEIFNFHSNDYGIFRGHIIDGNLNDGLIVSFKVDGMEREERLHWKYVDQHSTLIINDPNGFVFEFVEYDVDLAYDVMHQTDYYFFSED